MMATGRLGGTCASRPVELVAEGRELSLRLRDLRSAWRMRRSISAATAPILRMLRIQNIRLGLNIGQRWEIEVLPKPSLVLRLLCPTLRSLAA